jgi:NADP-dependent 3-hydroxy acid dehydrogenase YdfG
MEDATLSRVWFITGTSTGIGHLLTEEVLKRGERVIATARDVSQLSRLAQQYPDLSRAVLADH